MINIKTPEAETIIQSLGGNDHARFVGGCVRNAILGLPLTDIDIATKHTPDQVIKLLKEQGIKTIPTGIDHGTITAVIGNKPFEITTLRKDIDTDGRHATVAFSQSWLEDARRRDFTMNALFANLDGEIYDPLGQGLNDLKAHRVIFVGEAAKRITEDVLRILRFFRFHAIYGKGTPDQLALKACADHAHLIENLSKERITQEYLKILAADKARETLNIMHGHGIMPELTHITYEYFDKLNNMARLTGFEPQARAKYLRLSNAQEKEIAAIEKATHACRFENESQMKETLYYHGREATRQAHYIIKGTQDDAIENWNIPTFPITGEDLIKQGYKQGAALGKELRRLEKEWVESGFKH